MIYVVTMSGTASKDVEIEADSPEEAAKLAEERTPSLEIQRPRADGVSRMDGREGLELEAWEVVSGCELCLKPILVPTPEPEGYKHDYVHDEEGFYAHKECAQELASG